MSQQELTTKAMEANNLPYDRRFFPIEQVQAESKEHTGRVRALWTNIARTQQSNWRAGQ